MGPFEQVNKQLAAARDALDNAGTADQLSDRDPGLAKVNGMDQFEYLAEAVGQLAMAIEILASQIQPLYGIIGRNQPPQ